jgi:hypothetical protein
MDSVSFARGAERLLADAARYRPALEEARRDFSWSEVDPVCETAGAAS